MGVFSWECSHCKESIKNKYSHYSNGIVLVTLNNIFVDKKYCGYGTVNTFDIFVLSGCKGDIVEYNEITKLELDSPRSEFIGSYYKNKREKDSLIKCLHMSCYESLVEDVPTFTPSQFYKILDSSEIAEDQGHDFGF